MKKKLLSIVAMLMALSMCACSADKSGNDDIANEDTQSLAMEVEVQDNTEIETAEETEVTEEIVDDMPDEITSDDTDETTETEKTESEIMSLGDVSTDGVYSSQYTNLTFTAPADWTFYSREELNSMLSLAVDIMESDVLDFESVLENQTTVYDMMCVNMNTGANVLIMYENLENRGLAANLYTADKYADLLTDSFKYVDNMNVTELARENCSLGGMDFVKLTYETTMPELDVSTTQYYYLMKKNKNIVAICVSKGFVDEDFDETMIEKCFGTSEFE